jgi:hypothetical protein
MCWGWNTVGELGDGSTNDFSVPVSVTGLSDAVSVSAGGYHTCAVRANGEVLCWGDDDYGQLGVGSLNNSPVPLSVLAVGSIPPDTTDPTFGFVPPPIMVLATSSSGAPVTYNAPTATDAVDGPRPVMCVPASGSVFPVGKTTVTCAASDTSGNRATASFTVSVVFPSSCTSDGDCSAGSCVDGVCCLTGSCGSCQACNVAGSPGQCAPVPGGSADPRGTCVDQGSESCGTTGICDGAGGCRTYDTGTSCYTRLDFCDSIDASEICAGGGLACPNHPNWPSGGCSPLSAGTNVQLDLLGGQGVLGGITLTFQGTITPPAGQKFGAHTPPSDQACPTRSGFEVLTSGGAAQYYDIEGSPTWTASSTKVCIQYDPTGLTTADECQLQLQHADNSASCAWQTISGNGDVCDSTGHQCTLLGQPGTASCNAGQHATTICALSDHMSPFAITLPLAGSYPVIPKPADLVVDATDGDGAVVSYTVAATDATDGTLIPTCTPASGSKLAPGLTTVSCTATNSLQVSASTSFTVHVEFQAPTDGSFFQQPINPDDSSLFKGGSTIPVKFQLQGASAGVSNLVAHLLVARVSSGVTGTYLEATTNGTADSGNVFRSDGAGHYIYNLSTKGMASGTWSLRADLGDGVGHSVLVSLR